MLDALPMDGGVDEGKTRGGKVTVLISDWAAVIATMRARTKKSERK